ncbi:MAG: putative toxin-antitoxin system toxin component, PIN family [Bacteroidales bacterium]|nr:putative toxin-antitoxin system toxin component, PIN family [Bacteroidales bacterium]
MRIVLDTNCLIQVIPPRSPYHSVWVSFEKGENVLCISNEVLEEYAEILQRLIDTETAEVVVSTIINSPFVKFVTPYYRFNLIKSDPDDNKFVDCAIAAGARFLVSNDRHYDILKQTAYPKVDVLSLQEFMRLAM